MNQRNLNRLTMWKALMAILQKYKSVWENNAAFSEAVDGLAAMIAAADNIIEVQKGTTTGITDDKVHTAEVAVDKTLIVTRVARAYATRTGNRTLHAAVDFEKSNLYYTPIDELEARLRNMLDAALPLAATLEGYGLPAIAGQVAEDALAAFVKAAPTTRTTIANRKGIAATAPQIMHGGRHELIIMNDLIHLYDDNAPEFVNTYKAARIVVNAGVRHEAKKADDTTPKAS